MENQNRVAGEKLTAIDTDHFIHRNHWVGLDFVQNRISIEGYVCRSVYQFVRPSVRDMN